MLGRMLFRSGNKGMHPRIHEELDRLYGAIVVLEDGLGSYLGLVMMQFEVSLVWQMTGQSWGSVVARQRQLGLDPTNCCLEVRGTYN